MTTDKRKATGNVQCGYLNYTHEDMCKLFLLKVASIVWKPFPFILTVPYEASVCHIWIVCSRIETKFRIQIQSENKHEPMLG